MNEKKLAHIEFREKAFDMAKKTDPSEWAGSFDAYDEETPEDLARTLSIVAGAYDWTIDLNGRLIGLVAGDHGYATTSIVLSKETMDMIRDGEFK